MGLQQVLRQTPDGWELLSPDESERPIHLDLEREFQQWKRTLTSFRDQPLYRALGVKGAELPYVLDATCGLAGDSLQLLAYGCRVHSWERHPVPALMLLRAHEAWQHAVKSKWTLDLESFEIPEEANIIYFDPMYSEVSKKALPRKEMRIFREVVGHDRDAVEVAQRLRAQKKRLIIKRPPKSSELLPGVAFVQEGKAVRFDVYLP
jgi:16S rRNA (guanine1516-N2)-methyltransferase